MVLINYLVNYIISEDYANYQKIMPQSITELLTAAVHSPPGFFQSANILIKISYEINSKYNRGSKIDCHSK